MTAAQRCRRIRAEIFAEMRVRASVGPSHPTPRFSGARARANGVAGGARRLERSRCDLRIRSVREGAQRAIPSADRDGHARHHDDGAVPMLTVLSGRNQACRAANEKALLVPTLHELARLRLAFGAARAGAESAAAALDALFHTYAPLRALATSP